MNIDRTMNTELSQLRDLAEKQQKLIATLTDDKRELLDRLRGDIAVLIGGSLV